MDPLTNQASETRVLPVDENLEILRKIERWEATERIRYRSLVEGGKSPREAYREIESGR